MEFDHKMQDQVLIIIIPSGASLDARETRDFKEKMMELITQNAASSVVVDMQGLQFIDSSGLGAFLSILKILHMEGGELKLSNLNKSIRTIFELVSMHKVFEIYNSTEDAVLSFKS